MTIYYSISHRVAERGNRRQYAVSSRQEEVKRLKVKVKKIEGFR